MHASLGKTFDFFFKRIGIRPRCRGGGGWLTWPSYNYVWSYHYLVTPLVRGLRRVYYCLDTDSEKKDNLPGLKLCLVLRQAQMKSADDVIKLWAENQDQPDLVNILLKRQPAAQMPQSHSPSLEANSNAKKPKLTKPTSSTHSNVSSTTTKKQTQAQISKINVKIISVGTLLSIL